MPNCEREPACELDPRSQDDPHWRQGASKVKSDCSCRWTCRAQGTLFQERVWRTLRENLPVSRLRATRRLSSASARPRLRAVAKARANSHFESPFPAIALCRNRRNTHCARRWRSGCLSLGRRASGQTFQRAPLSSILAIPPSWSALSVRVAIPMSRRSRPHGGSTGDV